MTVCAICQREPPVVPLREGGGEFVCGKCVVRIAARAPFMPALFARGRQSAPSVEALDPDSRDDFDPREAEEILSEFKKGIAPVDPNEVETHLDLGVAYREMGLVPDAWGEFALVLEHARGKQLERALNLIFGKDSGYRGDIVALREALYPA